MDYGVGEQPEEQEQIDFGDLFQDVWAEDIVKMKKAV